LYDAESRLVEVKKNSTVIATFTYDGDGKQVKAVVNGVTTYYVGAHYQKQKTLLRDSNPFTFFTFSVISLGKHDLLFFDSFQHINLLVSVRLKKISPNNPYKYQSGCDYDGCDRDGLTLFKNSDRLHRLSI
jgi:YD repeat-containing protein